MNQKRIYYYQCDDKRTKSMDIFKFVLLCHRTINSVNRVHLTTTAQQSLAGPSFYHKLFHTPSYEK